MPHARNDTINWLPNHYYHLYNRGARQLTIFHKRDNYIFVLKKFKEIIQKYDLSMIAYVLMPNHYHLLVRQNGQVKAGLLPQITFNSYAKAYNHEFEHSGTIFQGRFEARVVSDDVHLRHLCRYIHANPVKDGFVMRPEQWIYSNYLEWIGRRPGTLFDGQFLVDYFESVAAYREFVDDYVMSMEESKTLGYLRRFDG